MDEIMRVLGTVDVQSSDKPRPRSVAPASFDELARWRTVAKAQGVSLHAFMLFCVREGVRRAEAGELTVEREEVKAVRAAKPEGY